ncbi:hypothetical protein [Hymenobacter jeollabukensis]|uniref:Uncharacterized protein n=1 Tax=Hymenobacter jeollabukensis TaxID=2025313 RepID=A0A5R8WNM7_9BACT|nr:hypothetical protein [Hymenobacter jeollabukensis]TLM91246.1 hypothetical protein FDY95_16785 [Hymenobacter jeollabukensis]
MKTHVYLLLSAGLLGACQRATDTETPAATAPVTAVTNTVADARLAAPEPAAPALPAEQLAVLQQFDLAPLLLPASYEDEEGARSAGQAMNGFFGSDHYRIEFVFTRVERDARNPALYHISGKDRYKKRVSPLEGTIELTQLQPMKPLEGSPNGELTAAYAATGQFELREGPEGNGSGVFRGKFALDFGRGTEQKPELATWGFTEESMAARRAGSRFEGQWTSNQTRKTKPVLWADGNGLFAIAQDVFADFNVGERGPEINEKYAKLGWNTYWENDEWWAESPKTATVSL